ncbi:hypothetical protein F5141DRAFT_449286 [Pisolithus sp. B1]|nr:hypothetical protein F5141DRAFT_449286 [Pisolithus sp. B1]
MIGYIPGSISLGVSLHRAAIQDVHDLLSRCALCRLRAQFIGSHMASVQTLSALERLSGRERYRADKGLHWCHRTTSASDQRPLFAFSSAVCQLRQGTTIPHGDTQTPNKEAAMQEFITSAVMTAVKPVTSGLDNLQKSLGSIVTHVENNTVASHADKLQSHIEPLREAIGTLQSEILREVDQRSEPLNSNLESLQNQTIMANQHLDELRTVDTRSKERSR